MNSHEDKTLDILRALWRQGDEILPLLNNSDSGKRYLGTQKAQRWVAYASVCFANLFYSSRFSDDFQKLIEEDDFGNQCFSSLSLNMMLGHIIGIGQMLKFGYLKDQFPGINNEASDICFVAMSFAAEYEDIYSIGIKPAAEKLGYQAIRVDRVHHNDKIDSKIIELIQKARFVIADFTGQRNGVYYEAGYAKGLGLPVIQTCMSRDFSQLHFDIQSINTLKYDSPSKLMPQLSAQIKETIGTYTPVVNQQPIASEGDIPF